MTDAYRVGEALAYLVRRMDGFCGVSGGDVLMYPGGDRWKLPNRVPARDVLRIQASHYMYHRDQYPDELRITLDNKAILSDWESPDATHGFLAALA